MRLLNITYSHTRNFDLDNQEKTSSKQSMKSLNPDHADYMMTYKADTICKALNFLSS